MVHQVLDGLVQQQDQEALESVITDYQKNDVVVKIVHADNEFRSVKKSVEEDHDEVAFNFALPDEHVPDIERENRVLEERFCTEYHLLPFGVLPRQMIREGLAKIVFNRNLIIKDESCSAYFSAMQMLWKKQVDYNKEFEFSFGAYVIAY